MQKKGQSSIEFIMLLGVLFFVFLLVFASFIYYSQVQSRAKYYAGLEDLSYRIKGEVELASEVTDGYIRTFNIPNKVNFRDYNLSMANSELTLRSGDYEFSLLVANFTGSLHKGDNLIVKQDGVVYINT
ncbi:hypothetical protein KY311_01795 [Candidatus Woesearchaeota archaeon]|nr:hypothetical protein [Candidatus Woesearchaeota archaeon]MBW3017229.1 hypothetical protein [Candidatus Woesearchaeota archaeon]